MYIYIYIVGCLIVAMICGANGREHTIDDRRESSVHEDSRGNAFPVCLPIPSHSGWYDKSGAVVENSVRRIKKEEILFHLQ